MKEKDLKNVADKAFENLGTETFDLIIEHEIQGITPEMLHWWWRAMMEPGNYKLWHPEDHVSAAWEVSPAGKTLVGGIRNVVEKIGKFPVRTLRIRIEDPSSSPIKATYTHVNATSIIGPDNKPVVWITHEYRAESYGVRMRSTFRLSKNSPQQFVDALRQHNKEEMGEFPNFLPELYRKRSQ